MFKLIKVDSFTLFFTVCIVFQGVNNALNFDYIIESDDSVNVDGINYPEWAALVTVDDEERIQTVKYSNFKVHCSLPEKPIRP